MYIMIDNFDSFTYNIVQYFKEVSDIELRVFRNNEITVEEVEKLDPEGIIISPGPGTPLEAGISVDLIRKLGQKIKIFGVCLGHQSIGEAYGANISQAKEIVHGKTNVIASDKKGIFRGINAPIQCTRYHSLVIDETSLPDCLEVTAKSPDGEIMGIRHKEYPVEGVQFHPESIASEQGHRMIKNFINYRVEEVKIQDILQKAMAGQNLEMKEASLFMDELTEGNLEESQIAAFLTALNSKGITSDEIAGCASILKQKKKKLLSAEGLLDTCGTGGDGLHTFNISSFSAILCASCGVKVAKHGNRAVSSKSGSSQFYEKLGINIAISPEKAKETLDKTGFVFLFAPSYHGAMRHAAKVRKDLGVKTIMNLLGPLVNPAEADYQIIGVYEKEKMKVMAEAAHKLGIKKALFVHGHDGLDEISVSTKTDIVELKEDGSIVESDFDAMDIIGNYYPIEDLKGGDAQENATMAQEILSGKGQEAILASVCINAGAGLYIASLVSSIAEGFHKAKEAIVNGDALRKLNEVINVTNS